MRYTTMNIWLSRLATLTVVLMLVRPAFAQLTDGSSGLGLVSESGVTVIDGNAYATITLLPEIRIGKVGVGLYVPLMFSMKDGSFRGTPYEGGYSPLRVVRYLSYGTKKQDPFYVRLGDLTGTSLGFGFIVYNYTNGTNFETTTIGVDLDVRMARGLGFEAMYSNVEEPAVIGLRPYVRPLSLLGMDVPIVDRLEVGALYVTDRSDVATGVADPITAIGLDAGIPIPLGRLATVTPYVAWASIADIDRGPFRLDGGMGAGIGTSVALRGPAGLFFLNAKIERRFFSDHFVGSLFDGLYESSKIIGGDRLPIERLQRANAEQATAGSLVGSVLGKVEIGGTLIMPDAASTGAERNPGSYLNLYATAPDAIPMVYADATYHRADIQDGSDVFKLDERSLASAGLGYRVGSSLVIGTRYNWTFSVHPETEELEVVSYITPFVQLSMSRNIQSSVR